MTVSYLHLQLNHRAHIIPDGSGSSWDKLIWSPYAAFAGSNLIQGEDLVFL